MPTPAGGANDARAVARRLGPRLGRTVSVDNRSGAHRPIASEYVARAAPDGGTLMAGSIGTHGIHRASAIRTPEVSGFAARVSGAGWTWTRFRRSVR